jgi:hypothetical protein
VTTTVRSGLATTLLTSGGSGRATTPAPEAPEGGVNVTVTPLHRGEIEHSRYAE